MADPRDRRHTRLVNRKFQFGLAWRLLLVLSALSAAGILLVFAPSVFILATRSELASLEPAAEEFLVLHRRIWPAALLSFGGIFLYALVFSHRIAGPVHRINTVLQQLLRNEYPETVKFRKNDYFHPTAELLARLSRMLADRQAGRARSEEATEERNKQP